MIIKSKATQADAWRSLREAEPESIDLIVTSPPYNIGKEYENSKTLGEYLRPYHEFMQAAFCALAPSGSICWQVGNYVDRGAVYPLDVYFFPIMIDAGFTPRNRIVWRFGHGLHCKNRFSGRYETIVWMTKSNNYKFNLDDVRVPSKYPGKRHYKGPKKGQLSGNPLGKNPSDVWEIVMKDWEEAWFDVPNVKHDHPEKTDHPCQFPIELVERLVLALTDAADVVVDPFCGAGSSIIAAEKNGRVGIGYDTDDGYVAVANSRLAELRSGNLKTRPIERGRP